MSQRVIAEVRPRRKGPIVSREAIIQWVVLLVILVWWELLGRKVGKFFLAGPIQVFQAAGELIGNGELGRAMVDSLSGLLIGLSSAAIIGIAVGYLMGWFPAAGKVLNPYISALYVLPIQALVPVIIIWLGIGAAPRFPLEPNGRGERSEDGNG